MDDTNFYIEYGKTENGSPFSIWQRSKQISDWIPTEMEITNANQVKTVYAGDIEITEELNTITLRKKLNRRCNCVYINLYLKK